MSEPSPGKPGYAYERVSRALQAERARSMKLRSALITIRDEKFDAYNVTEQHIAADALNAYEESMR